MKNVVFDLLNGKPQWPDDIDKFKHPVKVHNGRVRAVYSGDLPLEEFIPEKIYKTYSKIEFFEAIGDEVLVEFEEKAALSTPQGAALRVVKMKFESYSQIDTSDSRTQSAFDILAASLTTFDAAKRLFMEKGQ